MDLHIIKDKIQRKGLNHWFKAKCKGTLEYATGVGKSRCGVLAAEYVVAQNADAKILIITPTQAIRDEAWVDEFTKWKQASLLEHNVEIQCIQTAYKFIGHHYDLVIADEVHNYLPEVTNKDFQHFKFFQHNTYDKILALSASIETKLKPRLWGIAPIVHTITTTDALKLGLISSFEVFNVGLELSEVERIGYDEASNTFNETFDIFKDGRGYRNIQILFKCLSPGFFKHYCSLQGYGPEEYNMMKSWPNKCKNALNARKDILYRAGCKQFAIGEIVKIFPDRRGIIFSQSINFVEDVKATLDMIDPEISHSYHSKITKKVRKERMDDFNDLSTKSRIIISASALNEGVNLENISLAVIAAGTSKEKDFIQRLGRTVRLEEDKKAIMIRLYIKDSQEEKWLESSQENFRGKFLNSIDELKNIEGSSDDNIVDESKYSF